MKRSQWWIWSLIAGLVASGVIGWRVYSQRHEVQRQRIENTLSGIDAAALEGADAQLNPVSAQRRALADRLKIALNVPENESNIHPVNRPIFTYWEGWSRLHSGLSLLNEALGGDGKSSDPRPETYLSAWETIEQAAADSNFDIPSGLSEADYARFKSHVAKQWMADAASTVEHALDIQFESRDGKQLVRGADAEMLASIGIALADEAPEKPDLGVLVRGEPISALQRDFLATRLAVLTKIDDANLRIGRRLSELNSPQDAWQFRRVITEDIALPGSPYVLHAMTKRAYDAGARKYTAFLRMMKDPNDAERRKHYGTFSDQYDESVRVLAREIYTAAPEVQKLMDRPDETVLSKFEELRQANLRRLAALDRELDRLGDFDPELAPSELGLRNQDAATTGRLVAEEQARIDREKAIIEGPRRERLRRAEVGLDAIREFEGRVLSFLGATSTDGLLSLPDNEAVALFSDIGVPLAENARLLAAITKLTLADLSLVGTRASLLMNRGFEAKQGLARIHAAATDLRQVISAAMPGLMASPGIGSLENGSAPASIDAEIAANSRFLRALADELSSRSRAKVGPDAATRERLAQLAEATHQVWRSLNRIGGLHAEFSHQQVLEQLRELTGDQRPLVSLDAANRARRAWLAWERESLAHLSGARDDAPPHPLEVLDLESTPELQQLGRYIALEMEYRRRREAALAEYRALAKSEDPETARRAEFGIASLMMEDIRYQYGWKWENGFASDPMAAGTAAASLRNGVFSFVATTPARLQDSAAVARYPLAGQWLSNEESNEFYRRGPAPETVRELRTILARLRDGTAAADSDIFVAVRWLSGHLLEFTPSPRLVSAHGANARLGDIPAALRDYYIPLLQGPNGASDESVVWNRYIPLADEFDRLQRRVRGMIDSVDDGDAAALASLFASLAPSPDGRAVDEDGIADFWEQYYQGVAKRAPGMVALQDSLYQMNFDLAGLAKRRADLLLSSARTDSAELRRQAERANTRSRDLYRRAGKVLFDHTAAFPGGFGEAGRQFRIGDAFFLSGDYVFAIDAYKNYFNDRLTADTRSERAEPHYVVNRIGEAYMQIGIYEGAARVKAREANDAAAIAREEIPETMTIDGAIPAFEWNVKRVRSLMLDSGEGGLPRGSLPPAGALESFINLARAKIEFGRAKAAAGDPVGVAALREAAEILQRDLIDSRLFPVPVVGFNDSFYWRDAQYHIGLAELELARAHRSQAADQRDAAIMSGHLRRAAEAFDDILLKWPQPVNRTVYARALERGKSLAEAVEEVGSGSERFSDDIYYLAILNSAEVDWLRAVHHADPLSTEVVDALGRARPRLEFLLRELDAIHGKDSPVKGTTFAFPDLSRRARYLMGDVIFLHARTLRDRIGGGGSDRFEVAKHYQDAIGAYKAARGFYPNTHEAVWAYAQELNARRALATWQPDQAAEARRLLEAAPAYLASVPEAAFQFAPSGMTRQDFADFFRWYDELVQ